MIKSATGAPILLELTLFDGDETSAVKAFIRSDEGLLLDEVALSHVGSGTYLAMYTRNVPGQIVATFVVYTDDTFTQEDVLYARVSEHCQFVEGPSFPSYVNRMSTSFDYQTKKQEIIVWAEKDGQAVVGSDCRVAVKTAAGSEIYTASSSAPNNDGVFLFQNPSFEGSSDKNYYVTITIHVDGADRVSHQSFFTVG